MDDGEGLGVPLAAIGAQERLTQALEVAEGRLQQVQDAGHTLETQQFYDLSDALERQLVRWNTRWTEPRDEEMDVPVDYALTQQEEILTAFRVLNAHFQAHLAELTPAQRSSW